MTGDPTTPALGLGTLLSPRSPADGLLAAGVLVLAATPFVCVLARDLAALAPPDGDGTTRAV